MRLIIESPFPFNDIPRRAAYIAEKFNILFGNCDFEMKTIEEKAHYNSRGEKDYVFSRTVEYIPILPKDK